MTRAKDDTQFRQAEARDSLRLAFELGLPGVGALEWLMDRVEQSGSATS